MSMKKSIFGNPLVLLFLQCGRTKIDFICFEKMSVFDKNTIFLWQKSIKWIQAQIH